MINKLCKEDIVKSIVELENIINEIDVDYENTPQQISDALDSCKDCDKETEILKKQKEVLDNYEDNYKFRDLLRDDAKVLADSLKYGFEEVARENVRISDGYFKGISKLKEELTDTIKIFPDDCVVCNKSSFLEKIKGYIKVFEIKEKMIGNYQQN